MKIRRVLFILLVLMSLFYIKNVYAADKYTLNDYAYYDPVNGASCNEKNYWTPYNQNTTCYRFIVLTNNDTTSKTTLKVMLDHNVGNRESGDFVYYSEAISTLNNGTSSWTHYKNNHSGSISLPDESTIKSLMKLDQEPTASDGETGIYKGSENDSNAVLKNLMTNTLYSLNDTEVQANNYHTTHGYWLSGSTNSSYAYTVTEFGYNAYITTSNHQRGVRPMLTIKKEYLTKGSIPNSNIYSIIKNTSETREYKYAFLNKTFNNVTYKQMQGFTVAGSNLIFYSSNTNNKDYGLVFSYGGSNYNTENLDSENKECVDGICALYENAEKGNGLTYNSNTNEILLLGPNKNQNIWAYKYNNSNELEFKYNYSQGDYVLSSKYGARMGTSIGYHSDENKYVMYKQGRIWIVTDLEIAGAIKILYTFDAPTMEAPNDLEYKNGYVFLATYDYGEGYYEDTNSPHLYSFNDAYSAKVYVYNAKFNSNGTPSKSFGKLVKTIEIDNTNGNNDIGELEGISFNNSNVWFGYAAKDFDNAKPYKFYKTSFSNINSNLGPSLKVSYSETDTYTKVTIKNTSGDEIGSVSGWTLSDDKLSLSKNYYDSNAATSVKVCDRYGNCSNAAIKELTKKKQNVSFNNSSVTKYLVDGSYKQVASVSGDVSLTYSSSDTSVATVDNNGKVTFKKLGTVTITALANKTSEYYKDTDSYTLIITKAIQSIDFDTSSVNKTYGDSKYTKTAHRTAGGGKVTYSSSNTNVATVNENTGEVTIKKAGVTTITAQAAETDEYFQASASYTLNVSKASPELTFAKSSLTKGKEDPPFTNYVTYVGDSNVTISYYSSNPSIAIVDEETGEVTLTGTVGTATITATAFATVNYTDTIASYTINVTNALSQEISFDESIINKTYKDPKFIKTASHTVGNGEVSYTSTNKKIATVDEETGEVTIKSAGNVVIIATAEATEGYGEASASYVLKVAQKDQVLSFEASSVNKKVSKEKFTIEANHTEGDGKVIYTSDNTDVAIVDENTGEITIKGVGSVNITATAESTTNYKAVSAGYTLNTEKGNQRIEFDDSIKDKFEVSYGIEPFTLKFTQADGDGNLLFTSSDEKVATISDDGKITIIATGITTITITAEETDNYHKEVATIELRVTSTDDIIPVPNSSSFDTGKLLHIIISVGLMLLGVIYLRRKKFFFIH